jgi:F0F1-type ATP synthase epsilon subunit
VADGLRLEIRTPQGLVFSEEVAAVRVPTETGFVGLRPLGEPFVLAVEPGLIVVRKGGDEWFAATAGGLLDTDRRQCALLTPFAAIGRSESEMEVLLDQTLATPPSEIVARRRLEELEQQIIQELSRRSRVAGGGTAHG